MRQVAVVLWHHPTVVQDNVARFVKSLDPPQFTVVETMAVTTVAVLRNANLFAGRDRQNARRIDVEGRSAATAV